MKTQTLFFLTVFLLSSFLYATPQGAGIVLDGTGGLTVKDFKLTGNAFTVSAWVKVKNTDASQIFVSLGAPAQDWTLYSYNGNVRMLVENAPAMHYRSTLVPHPLKGAV